MKRILTILITCCFLTLVIIVLLRSSPSQIIQSQPILEEVPFHAGFADSIHMLISPRFINETKVCFCDLKDFRVMIVDGTTGSVQTIGKQGAGPSEFNMPASLAVWPGQGLVVYDTWLLRLSLFSETGEFRKMYWHQLAARMSAPHMYAIDEFTLAISPRGKSTESPDTDNVILIPTSLDTTTQFLAPEPVLSSAEDNPIGVDLSNVTLGSGTDGTILVAYHSDYRIRRYTKSGDLLWDSGSLDESFRPPSFQLPTREGYAVTSRVYNSIEAIAEIEGYGFATGIWAYQGNDQGGLPPWFVDLRDQQGKLITRIPMPDHLRIGDIYQKDTDLYILTYHLGQIELPTIRIFRIDLKRVRTGSPPPRSGSVSH